MNFDGMPSEGSFGQTAPNQASVLQKECSVGEAAYSELALHVATSRMDALEKELQEMKIIVVDHERRRHEAEAKACLAQRKAQDSETRFNISDKRRKDAEERTRELEAQVKDAMSLAWQSGLCSSAVTAESNRFDRIRGIFDHQAFEESKKRAEVEHKLHDLMRKRAEAEAKCLEETERRVQAEVRVNQETRIRVDEEMRNKALRSRLRDAEERIKMYEVQKLCEKQKGADAEDMLRAMLKQARLSLSQAEDKRKEAEAKGIDLEQKISSAQVRAGDYERKLEDNCKRITELHSLLGQAKADLEEKMKTETMKLDDNNKRVAQLQMLLDKITVPTEVEPSKTTVSVSRPSEHATTVVPEREGNHMLAELQTINTGSEVTIKELKDNIWQQEENQLKAIELRRLNIQLEATIQGLKLRLEQEDHSKLQLQATVEELEDTIRELVQKLDQVKGFQGPEECRRLSDSLHTLRVEENPLFRPEPVSDDLQRNFLSMPDSVTDDSQMSPRGPQDCMSSESQHISFASPGVVGTDSGSSGSPKSTIKVGGHCSDHAEKQLLLEQLTQNEALVADLRGRVQESYKKQLELEDCLREALQRTDAAEIKVDALTRQLEMAMQWEKERDKEYTDLLGNTSIRGKKEKWGLLERFRSKSKLDNQS